MPWLSVPQQTIALVETRFIVNSVNPIVILGAYRSGVSLLESLIRRFWAPARGAPTEPMQGGSDALPGLKSVDHSMHALEYILGRSHSDASGIVPLPDGWLDRDDVLREEQRLREDLERRVANGSGALLISDSRLLRFLPLYLRIFDDLGVSPGYVFVYRTAASAIRSRADKNGIPAELAQFLFLREVLDFLTCAADTRLLPDATIQFEDLIEDPRSALKPMAKVLTDELSEDSTGVLNNADRFIDKDAIQFHGDADPAWIVALCRTMDEIFQDLATGSRKWPSVFPQVRSLAADFENYTRPLIELARPRKSNAARTADGELLKRWQTLEQIEPRASDADTAEFPGLPVNRSTQTVDRARLKVCIATIDIVGPIRNGGIGTAYRYVADLLAGAGHDVTVLYGLGSYCETGTIQEWVDYYAARGVRFVPAPSPEVPNKMGRIGSITRISYEVYEWLKHQQFDVVHVSEWRGVGYYSLLAKRLGLAFEDTVFCVKCSSPNLWAKLGGNVTYSGLQDAGTAYMERRSVELADVVVSGSLHMLRWMLKHGYDIPRERAYVQPNIMLKSTTVKDADDEDAGRVSHDGEAQEIKEIVFFGRLEPRKGVHVFCAAIDRLVSRGETIDRIIFLGKIPKHSEVVSTIRGQSQRWQCQVEFLTDMGQPEALSYLAGSGRLAVIPSLLENSSFAIYECLVYGIHFLASDVGGNGELVHEGDRDLALFAPTPSALADKLQQTLRTGVRLWRPAFDYKENNREWLDWHASLASPAQRRAVAEAATGAGENGPAARQPLVSICIAHYERPKFLRHALESARDQTYRNIEIIIVDDGSSSEDAVRYLKDIERSSEYENVKVLRQENKYLGASRNTAARAANGEYLLFMDDDNVAKSHEVERFVQVMNRTNADFLTCFADEFQHPEYPRDGDAIERHTPLGASVSVGFFRNGYGDSNALVRRSAFEALGGFTEEYRIGRDDQELFSRAVLQGYRLEIVPEALFWYRKNISGSMKDTNQSIEAGQMRVLRPYLESLPAAFQNLLMLAVAFYNDSQESQSSLTAAQRRLRRLEHKHKGMIDRAAGLFLAAERRTPRVFTPLFQFVRRVLGR